MTERERLKARRKRRQAAFLALEEMSDRLKIMRGAFSKIDEQIRVLQEKWWYFLFHPTAKARVLAAIAGHTEKAQLLEEISNRVEAIRAEFSALRHSDERELKELEAILPPNPTR